MIHLNTEKGRSILVTVARIVDNIQRIVLRLGIKVFRLKVLILPKRSYGKNVFSLELAKYILIFSF